MNELPIEPNNDLKLAPTDITQMSFFKPDLAQDALTVGVLNSVVAAPVKPMKKLSKISTFLKKRSTFEPPFILTLILIAVLIILQPAKELGLIEPMAKQENLSPLSGSKPGYEVFGFAPHWTFDRLDNIDFETLTTLAYFGVEAKPDGNLDTEGPGYKTFMSPKATELFKKAHKNGTRVVLTLTQMNNDDIKKILDDPALQASIINQSTEMVRARGIDGINIDFEYVGTPDPEYREKFSVFTKNLSDKIHSEVPGSKVTVSVYASSATKPKLYDIKALSGSTDGIFMMAYDFAVAGSSNAIPTAPLYGHKEGKYWYDISTAVEEFLTQMPADKLILGVPWYGYNYAVESPEIKTATKKGYYTYYKKGRRTYSNFVPLRSHAQTYALVKKNINAQNSKITDYQEGFDEIGKVSWRAYSENGIWRMIFIDDPKSLAYKYDFAKDKNLAGVGMWALGFDDGNPEIWDLLKEKFGAKNVADSSVTTRQISD